MTITIDGKVAGAFSIALLSLGLLGFLAYTSLTKFTESTQWAAHAQTVLAELDDVPLAMERAEGAQLRYLLTNDENYLVAYRTAASDVEKELDEVRQLTTDNPAQRDRVATLTTLAQQRLAKLQEAITTQDTEGADEALDTLMTSEDTTTREDIHQVTQDMEAEESQFLAQHAAAATTHARSMRRLTVAASTFAFLLVGLAGVLLNRDVLRRRRAEAALRESEARYRTLVESTREGLVSITLDGKIAAINHGLEMMLDWSREELVGRSYGTLLTPVSVSQSEERLRHAFAVERLPSIYEAECVRRDGSVVPVEVRASFLRDGTGQIQGLLALHHDISIKKALEQSYIGSSDRLHDQHPH